MTLWVQAARPLAGVWVGGFHIRVGGAGVDGFLARRRPPL